MIQFLLVCLGGALGTGARFAIALAVPRAVLVVNLIGSCAIAMAMELMRPTDARLIVVTGILGGFTTYSAFNQETLQLLQLGKWGSATLNVAVTLFGCLAAGFLGAWLARARF